MMLRISLAFAVAALVMAGGWAGHGAYGEDDQPMQALAVSAGDEALLLYYAVPVAETREEAYTVTVKVPVEVDGQTQYRDVQETRNRTAMVYKLVTRQAHADAQTSQLSEIDGRPVAWDTLSERLKKPTLVLVTQGSQPIPRHYALRAATRRRLRPRSRQSRRPRRWHRHQTSNRPGRWR